MLNKLTATELIHKLRQGEITVSDICEACLKVVREKEDEIRAFEYLDADLVQLEAERLDSELDRASSSLLYGAPVGLKDIFNTKDMPTTMGSPIWEGFTPGNDARVVHALREEQALIFGKTVTAEFAYHSLYKDKTVNPHNYDHIPGTSSSGSAAAVAAEMIPLALGTQTAGSIIRPASYCGVIGFKPTFGTVPRTGSLKTTDSLDSIGGFARSIDDIRLLFDTIRVRGRDYPHIHNTLDKQPREVKTARVAVLCEDVWVFEGFQPYTLDALQGYVDVLNEDASIQLTPLKLPGAVNHIHDIHTTIYDKALSYYFENEYEVADLMSEVMREAVEKGSRISSRQYHDALNRQIEVRREINAALVDVDFIIVPSTAGEAPLRGQPEQPDTCLIWTFLGCPAISLPLFRGPKNLPLGLQVVGKRFADYDLLEVARRLSLTESSWAV